MNIQHVRRTRRAPNPAQSHPKSLRSVPPLVRLPACRLRDPTSIGNFSCPFLSTSCIGALCKSIRRSEEHTSELQSLMRISYAVFCLKKKKHNKLQHRYLKNRHTRNKLCQRY